MLGLRMGLHNASAASLLSSQDMLFLFSAAGRLRVRSALVACVLGLRNLRRRAMPCLLGPWRAPCNSCLIPGMVVPGAATHESAQGRIYMRTDKPDWSSGLQAESPLTSWSADSLAALCPVTPLRNQRAQACDATGTSSHRYPVLGPCGLAFYCCALGQDGAGARCSATCSHHVLQRDKRRQKYIGEALCL